METFYSGSFWIWYSCPCYELNTIFIIYAEKNDLKLRYCRIPWKGWQTVWQSHSFIIPCLMIENWDMWQHQHTTDTNENNDSYILVSLNFKPLPPLRIEGGKGLDISFMAAIIVGRFHNLKFYEHLLTVCFPPHPTFLVVWHWHSLWITQVSHCRKHWGRQINLY